MIKSVGRTLLRLVGAGNPPKGGKGWGLLLLLGSAKGFHSQTSPSRVLLALSVIGKRCPAHK